MQVSHLEHAADALDQVLHQALLALRLVLHLLLPIQFAMVTKIFAEG